MRLLSHFYRQQSTIFDIAFILFLRGVQLQYAQSLIGILWPLVQPLAFTVITSIVFSSFFEKTINFTSYPFFVLSGFVVWIFFSSSLKRSATSLVRNRDIVTHTNLPMESLVISSLLTALLDHVAVLGVTFFAISIVERPLLSWSSFGLPIVVFFTFLFVLGLGFIVAALHAYFRDAQSILDICLQLLFFSSPVIYPTTIIPSPLISIFNLNPLAFIIDTYRMLLFGLPVPIPHIVLFIIICIGTCIVGKFTFKVIRNKIPEYI